MSKYLVIILTLVSTQFVHAQLTQIAGPDFNNKKLSYYINDETRQHSILFPATSTYINGDDVAQPVIFRRTEKDLPELLVYYTAARKDSTIMTILYEWDNDNFKKDATEPERPLTELKPFITKYKQLLAVLTAQYGKPVSEGELDNMSLIETGDYNRTDNWENDSTNVEMYMVLSNKYGKWGVATVNPSHRIRLYLKSNKKRKDVFDKQKTDSANLNIKKFLSILTGNTPDSCKRYLAPSILPVVTTEQIANIKKVVVDDNWELFFNGVQLTLTGKSYLKMSYKRKMDTAQPPLEMLDFLLDDEGKILALQPKKR